jgi:hypothetical protein
MNEQKIIKEADEEIVWVKDEMNSNDAEKIKLDIGESVEGILVDKGYSDKWNAHFYKIKTKDAELPKWLWGSTVLDNLMAPKVIGDLVKIVRLEDGMNTKGVAYSNWETYHTHKSSSVKQ